jgi:hypothetical protein
MLNVHGGAGTASVRGMLAPPRLNTGFLVRGNDELIVFQGLIFPSAGVQIQEASSFVSELGVARKDPTAVIPRPNSVLMQPTPNGAATNGSHQPV